MTDRNGWSARCNASGKAGVRLFSLAAACLLVVTGVVASHAGQPVTGFTSAIFPRITDRSVGGEADRAVARAFHEAFPQYRVEPFLMPAIGGAMLDAGPLMGIAAGNPPHALYVNFRQSSSYINHGFLEPLETLLARVQSGNPRVRETDRQGNWIEDPAPEDVAYWRDRILDRIPVPIHPVVHREADARRRGVPRGLRIWAMPTSIEIKALAYRRDVFREAGLDPDRGPETWDELLAFARRIHALEDRFGLLVFGGRYVSWGAYSFLVADGGRYVARDPSGRWRAAFNTPETAEAIYFLHRLLYEPFEVGGRTVHGAGLLSMTREDRALWRRGQVGMQFVALDHEMLADINPEITGLVPVPASPRGGRAGELNARMVGVFRGATPEQQLGIMRYIWFLTGDEAQRIRTEVFVNSGYGRFLNPELLARYGYEEILRKIPQGWRETFAVALESGVPEPYGHNTQFIYEEVSAPINWALHAPLLDMDRDAALAGIRERLAMAEERVNRYVLGELSREEWRRRRWIGGSILGLLLVILGFCIRHIWYAFRNHQRRMPDLPHRRRFIRAYLMLAPALLVVVFWQYIPLALGLPMALFDVEFMAQSTFVGIDNFATILYDPRFWRSLGNTFYYALLVVGLGFWPPILLAVLLDEVPTAALKYTFRTLYCLPMTVSGIVMVFLWVQFFDPTEVGYLNQVLLALNRLGPISASVLKLLLLGTWLSLIAFVFTCALRLRELRRGVRIGLVLVGLLLVAVTLRPILLAWRGGLGGAAFMVETGGSGLRALFSGLVGRFDVRAQRWLHDPGLAMVCVVVPGIWAASGPGSLIYLASLKSVSRDLIESAAMDGAGVLERAVYITLSRIRFLIMIQLVGAIMAALIGGTDLILAMTGGGPDGATRILDLDIFQRAFMELDYGIGVAMAWVLGALVMVVTAFQLHRLSRAEFRVAKP